MTAFLYSWFSGFVRLQEIINTWRNDINPILFKKLYPDGDNKETFKHIFKVMRLSFHIIDCKAINIQKYMKEIQEVENITSYQVSLTLCNQILEEQIIITAVKKNRFAF